MARTTELKCDICKQPTKKIVAKLFFTPIIPGVSRSVHSNYTHHCDVGECCQTRLLRGFKFNKRITSAEYQEQRRNGTSG